LERCEALLSVDDKQSRYFAPGNWANALYDQGTKIMSVRGFSL